MLENVHQWQHRKGRLHSSQTSSYLSGLLARCSCSQSCTRRPPMQHFRNCQTRKYVRLHLIQSDDQTPNPRPLSCCRQCKLTKTLNSIGQWIGGINNKSIASPCKPKKIVPASPESSCPQHMGPAGSPMGPF